MRFPIFFLLLFSFCAHASCLDNWWRGGVAGKKIVYVGDSTTQQMGPVFTGGLAQLNDAYLKKYVLNPGSPLYGVTEVWQGASGNTIQKFITNTGPANLNISDAIAAAGDLYVMGYGGTNDVRVGGVSQQQLVANMQNAVDQIIAALPNACVVIRMANSFLTTDVGPHGWIVPNSAAQSYSDIMRNAARAMDGYKGAILYDAQALLFPDVAQPSYLYMFDQVHPNAAGYLKIFDQMVAIYGKSPPINTGLIDHAQAVNYAQAWTLYPRVLEGGDYDLIAQGFYSGQGAGYIDFAAAASVSSLIQPGDIVSQNGQAAFMLPAGTSVAPSSGNIHIANLGSNPSYAQVGGLVTVWRSKYASNAANKTYAQDPQYNFQQNFSVVSAGMGSIQIVAFPDDRPAWGPAWAYQYLLHPILGPISLAGAAVFQVNGTMIEIDYPGKDFSMTTSQVRLIGKKF